MNHEGAPACGPWFLMLVDSAVFVLFAFSLFKPKTRRDAGARP